MKSLLREIQLFYSQKLEEHIKYANIGANSNALSIYKIYVGSVRKFNIHPSDVTFLSSKIEILRDIEYHINTQLKENTTTTFETKEEYEPDDATKRWVQDILKDLPENSERPDLNNFKLWRPVINERSPFGYKGRVVVMEQMVITDRIQRFLSGDEADMSPEKIEQAAKEEGMITLLQRGVLAALRGETTLEEVNRVI